MIISVKSRIMNHLIGYLREFPLVGSRVHYCVHSLRASQNANGRQEMIKVS